MTTDHETRRLVRSWLRRDDSPSADQILDDVRELLDVTPQRHSVRVAWSGSNPKGAVRFAVGAVAAVAVVAVIGVNMLGSFGVAAPSSSPAPVPSRSHATSQPVQGGESPKPLPFVGPIEPGRYAMRWLPNYPIPSPERHVYLTVPPGWEAMDNGLTVFNAHAAERGGNAPTLSIHPVARVIKDACARDEPVAAVGPSPDELIDALVDALGSDQPPPVKITLDGYPATKFSPVFPPNCPGPEGQIVWVDATSTKFVVWHQGTADVYIVDVYGDRLVISSQYRGAEAGEIAELEAIVDSIQIER